MNKAKVLIADDSPIELLMIAQPFVDKDYEVITAQDGEEALRKASAEKPDLIVLDIVMPKFNGYQVCKKIRDIDLLRETPVILLSTKNQDDDKFYGIMQGASAYMTKPFTYDELLDAAARLL